MSFSGSVKYNLTWTSLFGESCELKIKRQGYAGAATRVKCAGNPIQLDWVTPGDYILDPINGSTLTIYLVAETTFEFLDLYTSNARKYLVEYLVGGSIKWTGYILPDQYQRPYQQAPYVNAIIAADQLGYLKTIVWDKIFDTSTEYGYYTPSLLEALEWIFEKTDLDLDMREGINMYSSAIETGTAKSPLNQVYFHGIAYTDKTYYDVLEDILKKFTAVLKQRNGEWFIFRPIEAGAAFTTRLWTYLSGSFSYDSNEQTDLVVNSTSASVATASLVRIGAGGGLHMRPGWKKYNLFQDYGLVANRLLNGDFTLWTGRTPNIWIIHPSLQYYRSGNKFKMWSLASRYERYITQQINTAVGKWEVTVKYNVYVPSEEILTVYFQAGTKSFVIEYDNTSLDSELITEPLQQEVTITEVLEPSSFIGPPAYKLMSFAMEQPVGTSVNGYIELDEVTFKPIGEGPYDQYTYEYEGTAEEVVELDPDNNYDYGQISLITSDYPVRLEGFRDVFRGALFQEFDAAFGLPINQTILWSSPEGSGFTLAGHLRNTISALHLTPQQVLSVSVYSINLDPATVIQELNNSNKLFLIKRATWNTKHSNWVIEAYEIGTGVGLALLAETGLELEAEDGQVLRAEGVEI